MKGLSRVVIAVTISLITLGFIPSATARSTVNSDHYKLYAHFKIISDKQYQCFYKIIDKESRWNPAARNGSHYGLGQMRSRWYGSLDAYAQIDATLIYIAKRYGSSCKAWAYHVKRGWY